MINTTDKERNVALKVRKNLPRVRTLKNTGTHVVGGGSELPNSHHLCGEAPGRPASHTAQTCNCG